MNRRKLLGMFGAAPLAGGAGTAVAAASANPYRPATIAEAYEMGVRAAARPVVGGDPWHSWLPSGSVVLDDDLGMHHFYFAVPETFGRQLTWFVSLFDGRLDGVSERVRGVIWDDGKRDYTFGGPSLPFRRFGRIQAYHIASPKYQVSIWPTACYHDAEGQCRMAMPVFPTPSIDGDDLGEVVPKYLHEILLRDKICGAEKAPLLTHQPPYDINELMAAAKSQLGWIGPFDRSQS